jgi:hypothetical protein
MRWPRQNHTLTEHDFQDAFKNGRSAGNSAYVLKGTTTKSIVASRPKVNFWPDGSMNPGNYGYKFVQMTGLYKRS